MSGADLASVLNTLIFMTGLNVALLIWAQIIKKDDDVPPGACCP